MPLPLVAVAVYEFVMWAVGWIAANGVRVALWGTAADALTDGGFDEVLRRVRAMVASLLNFGGEFDFTENDFRGVTEFTAAITRQAAARSGIPLRNLLDKQMVVEDLENYALMLIGERTGIRLTSLRDVEGMKRDFLNIAGGVITERTGIPFTDLTDPEAIKADVMSWAQDQVMMQLGDDVHAAVNAEWKEGVTMLQMLKDRTGKDVSPKALLRGVNDAMVQRYMVKIEEKPGAEKKRMRRYQNMMNQRRFRARADPNSPMYDGRRGGKQIYQPVGVKLLWQDKEGQVHELSQE